MSIILKPAACLFLTLLLGMPAARGARYSATSPTFALDLTQRGVAVQGRVVDADTRQPLNGAAVSLAGASVTSGGDGRFSFSGVTPVTGLELVASKSGYVSASIPVDVVAGTASLSLPDVGLPPEAPTPKPVITRVASRYPNACFLYGVPVQERYTARVNWNGRTPGTVIFRANGELLATRTGPGPDYTYEFDVSSVFRPSLAHGANKLTITATDQSGLYADEVSRNLVVVPMPEALQELSGALDAEPTGIDVHISVDFSLPEPPFKQELDLPVLGKFGAEFGVNGSFDYTLSDGEFDLLFGIYEEGKRGKRGRRPKIPGLTRYPKLKVYFGNKEISGKIQGGVRGNATPRNGITFKEMLGKVELQGQVELGRISPLLLIPGLSTAVSKVPSLDAWAKNVTVIVYAKPALEGEATIAFKPIFEPKSLEVTGKLGFEAAYETKVKKAEVSVYVGGDSSLTLGLPDLFRNVRLRAYGGIDVEVWLLDLSLEVVFLNKQFPSAKSARALLSVTDTGTIGHYAVINPTTWQPVARQHLKRGLEGFVPGGRVSKAQADALFDFRLMGQSPTRGSVGTGKNVTPTASTTVAPSQADLALIANVFPKSSPAMAGRDDELMLLYVGDNGSAADLQFTDIRWTFWDGVNWSTPQTLHTNTQAEFAPQVVFDGNGDAIAVWERVGDPAFDTADVTAMAREMEVVWSRWNKTSGSWSTPSALTGNQVLDYEPLLCGPMADGSVLAVWTRNSTNVLMGTNGSPDEVLWSRWDAGAGTWSPVQSLLTGVVHKLSRSLAGAANRAVYVWSTDADGVITNQADQQVFRVEWNGSTWGAPAALTSDAASNRNARVAVSAAGEAYVVWQRGDDLVMNRNFTSETTVVRAEAVTAGYSDFAMTLGPGGNLVLLWQEMGADGSDAHYAVYDPVSRTWSREERLLEDQPLERSFAPVWDHVGNLTVAYNKVALLQVDKTVALEGGGFVTVSNVTQAGQVDLYVTKRALIRDMALREGDFTATGSNFLPGDPVTLMAMFRNEGDVGASDQVLEFFEGDPSAGGVLIGAVTNAGWMEGASSSQASVLWVVPEPAMARQLYAVINRSGAGSEFNATNNQQMIAVGGVDLDVAIVSAEPQANGAMQVVASVQNLGAPASPGTTLSLHRWDPATTNTVGSVLTSISVPALDPGRLAQLVLDVPAGTQPEGNAIYALSIDEAETTADVELDNNRIIFPVNLWLDSDDDGLPDYFEKSLAFLSENNASDAEGDYDGDGISNLDEFRAGTAPDDPASYLKVDALLAQPQVAGGFRVSWGSVSNRLYRLERAPDLMGEQFELVAEHIQATPPVNQWEDITATNAPSYYYRVLVE